LNLLKCPLTIALFPIIDFLRSELETLAPSLIIESRIRLSSTIAPDATLA
jgi:hypothetical protein